jgi:ABC-type phosphate transport system auxiliary subunit
MDQQIYQNLKAKLSRLKAERADLQASYDFFVASTKDEKQAKQLYLSDMDELDAQIALIQRAVDGMEPRRDGVPQEAKDYALASWIQAGGDPNGFAAAWPMILQDIKDGQIFDGELDGESDGQKLAGHQAVISQNWGNVKVKGLDEEKHEDPKPQKAEW